MTSTRFAEQLARVPTGPGVYIMRGADATVIYVGKAANLRNRVRSYFGSPSSMEGKTRALSESIADFEYVLTHTEQEALHLEAELVKRHQPFFNIRLKDDKHYPYLKVDLADPWPRVYITRRVEKDGARYFGPYANAGSVRRTLDLVNKLFPWRSCTKTITGTDPRPCLDYYINRCIAPCTSYCTKEEYDEVIRQVILFLEGRTDEVVRELRRQMQSESEAHAVRAGGAHPRSGPGGRARDRAAGRRQHEAGRRGHLRAGARRRRGRRAGALRPRHQDGRRRQLHARRHRRTRPMAMSWRASSSSSTSRRRTSRSASSYRSSCRSTRSSRAGSQSGGARTSSSLVPQRGEKRRLVEMAAANARESLDMARVKWLADSGKTRTALEGLQEALDLPALPKRIECYDISNIQGTSSVGSMVVAIDGHPRPQEYRRFRIKTVEGANDFASMAEVLRRRFRRAREQVLRDAGAQDPNLAAAPGEDGARRRGDDESFAALPDLVIIDGGKGQLAAVLDVMREMGVKQIPAVGLAKQHEEIYVQDVSEPVVLPRTSQALYLVQRVRDEAHRFAITYHRGVRKKAGFQSALDTIPGVGPKRKKALLKKFGSVRGIREAPADEIASTVGFTAALAEKVKASL